MLDTQNDSIRQLRDAFGTVPTGVTVVTLCDDKGRATGITVGSFSSLSLEPALVMFSVGSHQVSCRWFERCTHFNVNVLSAHQAALAHQFAKPLKDKFAGVDWHEDQNGTPAIEDTLATFSCRKWNIMEAGDHWIVLGEIKDFRSKEGEPLVFHGGQMRHLAS
ncbi:MAG: flavin reductase family protein [Alphaproteobacteria bacterium]|nr:flavin reductase family protein [Alphaproteobacteria bacterium]